MEKVNVTPAALDEIFVMQKQLMEHYIRIEGLPGYPLNLNEKSSQKVLKDFMGRIIGELSEAYEVILNIWVNENDNVNYDKAKALEEFNMEVADVMHFFVETLIFSGFDTGDIQNFLAQVSSDNPGSDTFLNPDSAWLSIFNFANYQNMKEGVSFNQVVDWKSFPIVDKAFIDTQRPELAGGRAVSGQIMQLHTEYMWEITYMLNKAIAFLKHKEWSQSERQSNLLSYRQCMLEAFLHFFRYMDFMGQNSIGLYHAYYRKNQILHKRIENGY